MKRKLILAVAVVILAVVGAGVWFYSSLDSLVKAGIEKYVPPITQTSVKVGSVKLSPTDGTGSLSDFVLGNPKGFKTPYAISVGSVNLAVDPASLAKDVITIRRIAIAAPKINYETSSAGSNFDVIKRNVQKYLGPSAKKDKEPGKKMIIDALTISNAKVSYAPALLKGKTLSISLPDIALKNIGKAKGGVTGGELAGEIVGALKSQITHSVGNAMKGIGKEVGSAASKAVQGVTKGIKGLFGK